jgi:energy-coupling factor transporter ATP-binding protein EcfA2
MIGRLDTINILAGQLQQRRFVTIVGPGGIGKTTVALAVAENLVDSYEHRACFLDVASLTDPLLLPNALPARVPPSASRQPPPDNDGSFASKLLGLFGWKSTPKTQVASADPTTLERGAHSAATGTIVAPKAKLASQIYTVTGADPSEPPPKSRFRKS